MTDFIENIPDQYVKNASKTHAKPIPLGTFNTETRWKKLETPSPGVGDYDLTGFKSYAKVAETTFEIPSKQTNI